MTPFRMTKDEEVCQHVLDDLAHFPGCHPSCGLAHVELICDGAEAVSYLKFETKFSPLLISFESLD